MDKGYNVNDAARCLGITPRTLRAWIRTKKCNANKIVGSRRYVVTESEIRRLRGEKRHEDECKFYTERIKNN